jgi:hypothetical protein
MKVDADTLSGVRWVSEKVFAEIHGLSRQTLTNWRYKDRRAGRSEAPAGFPQYRYFGSTVRYRLDEEDLE